MLYVIEENVYNHLSTPSLIHLSRDELRAVFSSTLMYWDQALVVIKTLTYYTLFVKQKGKKPKHVDHLIRLGLKAIYNQLK